MTEIWWISYKVIIKGRDEFYCSPFYADIKWNSNFRTFSRNIHFEVKYLENGFADYSYTYFIL